MALEDIAKRYYKTEGYNCAETLLHAANEYYDLGLHDHDMRTMAGLAAGCLWAVSAAPWWGHRQRCLP